METGRSRAFWFQNMVSNPTSPLQGYHWDLLFTMLPQRSQSQDQFSCSQLHLQGNFRLTEKVLPASGLPLMSETQLTRINHLSSVSSPGHKIYLHTSSFIIFPKPLIQWVARWISSFYRENQRREERGNLLRITQLIHSHCKYFKCKLTPKSVLSSSGFSGSDWWATEGGERGWR